MRVVKRDCPHCGYEWSREHPATLARPGDGYDVRICNWCDRAVCTPSRLMTLGYPMFTHPNRALGLNLFFTLQWVLLLALLIWPAFLLAAFVRLCQSTVRTAEVPDA
jgi:hypothetical protein